MTFAIWKGRLKYDSTLVELPRHQVSFQLDDPCINIARTFAAAKDLPGILIYDKTRLHSMISRTRYLEIMHLPYSKELFTLRTIGKLANHFKIPATIFPIDMYIGQAAEEALARDGKLISEPIIVAEGESHSVIDTYTLLRSQAQIFSVTVKSLKQEISQSNELRERLEQARKEAELMARLDGLTGIPNRRHMDEYLAKEWQRALREETSLSVVLIDIDYFKAFNDRYGHQAGDEALIQVAQCLSYQAHRPADLVARYGGEEFIAVLPDTNTLGAGILAEKMRAAVERLQLINEGSQAHRVLTISCGLACLTPQTDLRIDKILQDADEALYRAKSGGRNQVEMAQSKIPSVQSALTG